MIYTQADGDLYFQICTKQNKTKMLWRCYLTKNAENHVRYGGMLHNTKGFGSSGNIPGRIERLYLVSGEGTVY